MSRTMFVNPGYFTNPKGKGKKGKKRGKKRRGSHSLGRFGMRGRVTMTRRNAGLSPFLQQNPLILSNPKRRRRARKNPIGIPSMKSVLDTLMSAGGGAGLALVVNTVGTSKIQNAWYRRAAQFAAAVIGGQLVSSSASSAMGSAFTGAMMYPLAQDVAADLLAFGVGAGAATAKEADLDALAADLEDVLDDMDGEGSYDEGDELSADDEMYDW